MGPTITNASTTTPKTLFSLYYSPNKQKLPTTSFFVFLPYLANARCHMPNAKILPHRHQSQVTEFFAVQNCKTSQFFRSQLKFGDQMVVKSHRNLHYEQI